MKADLRVVMAWGCQCRATHQNVNHLQSDQEEADTKMLLHVDATTNGATELYTHSPDTDALVLSLRRYPELCVKTSFVTGTGDTHRVIDSAPIARALGSAKLAALTEFHSLSGADITGSFSRKRKFILESVLGRRRRYHNCFGKPWNHVASPRRDISPC